MSQYNFVILGSKNEIFKISFQDILQQDNVVYLDDDISSKNLMCKFLHWFHFSRTINRLFPLPFKNFWNSKIVSFSFNKIKPLCFILFTSWVKDDPQTKIISFLRSKYPSCKIVWFSQDILSTVHNTYTGKLVDVAVLKKRFDLIVSYDMGDSNRYGLEYHPTVLSKMQILSSDKHGGDLFFIGKSKNRLDLLIELSKGFREYGVKCNFMVLGIPVDERKDTEYINYIDKPLTYRENLEYVANAKCLLELMQPGAIGYTFRTSEALLYNKKLITNNVFIENAPFFNSDNIVVIKNLSKEFFEQAANKILYEKLVQYNNIEMISPHHLLKFIEEKMDGFNSVNCF